MQKRSRRCRKCDQLISAIVVGFEREFHVLFIVFVIIDAAGVMDAQEFPNGEVTFFTFVLNVVFHQ